MDGRFQSVLQLDASNGGGMESAITSKGQATIPKAVRDHLGVGPGDRVKFFIQPDGSVFIVPRVPISSLRGIIKPRPGAAPTIEEMDQGILNGVAEEYLAGLR